MATLQVQLRHLGTSTPIVACWLLAQEPKFIACCRSQGKLLRDSPSCPNASANPSQFPAKLSSGLTAGILRWLMGPSSLGKAAGNFWQQTNSDCSPARAQLILVWTTSLFVTRVS